ncbi:HAD family hydrolase [Atopobacter sp. AH10]|uniref:HAD family hydrolase n=1 Tax=Atopobacter sp. AH10 TaxID=2315861 RepID=UPI000EF1CD00|nr:HAD family hydrolase [Atopobacter sp. AH10]RLK63482.1 HAD family hydrolase [Atopobacter sp. AH10]
MIDLSRKKMIIFDLDGTLIDSERLYKEGWKKGFQALGYKESEEFFEAMSGNSVEQNNKIVLQCVGDADLVQKIRQVREDYFNQIADHGGVALMPGVLESLDSLHQRGIILALATLSSKKRADRIFAQRDIRHYFSYMEYQDTIHQQKPDPEVYLKVIDRSGFKKEEVLIVEDSQNGYQAAMNAKVDTLLVSDHVIRDQGKEHVQVMSFPDFETAAREVFTRA